MVMTNTKQQAWDVASSVLDPELPMLTVGDLGILRDLTITPDGLAHVKVTPTYSGCPAVAVIELEIETALAQAGFTPKIERVLHPPWTSDWLTTVGREKLQAAGIAPPVHTTQSVRGLFDTQPLACPACGSMVTERISEFGSTACKALYRCKDCAEPFDYFKCF